MLTHRRMCDKVDEIIGEATETELESKEVSRLRRKIKENNDLLDSIRSNIATEEAELRKLQEEYGPEISRVKKEFSRMKERAYEESSAISNKAKIDALKEVLPITDNYFRAKGLYQPLQTDNEKKIAETYDNIFASFSKVIEDFGVTRVISLGQPFDFNMMEAIMTAPSTEYAKDIVCTEYQVGYKMGDKCIRPAMVVVSLGPGPSS